MLYEDPLDWDHQIRQGQQLAEQYRLALRVNPLAADPDGPFVGTPFVTTRAAFDRIRSLPEDLPLREPLLHWAFRLAEARVNAELERQLAMAWRTEALRIDQPRPIETTRADLLARVLSDGVARSTWLELLGQHLDGLTQAVSLLWQRREELAQRAGFANLAAATHPIADLQNHVTQWQLRVKAAAEQAWGRDPLSAITAGLANQANRGWPARLGAHSVVALLGSRGWLARVVREPRWPQLIGPTSFLRALHAFGCELASAWATNAYPFVLAHRAGRGAGQRLGFLLAGLVTNLAWQRRVLGLHADQAREQVRALANALLFAGHGLCLKVLLARAATQSASALQQAHGQYLIEVFGFELPRAFAGLVPRLDTDDAHALIGFWMGLAEHERLRQAFDVDWFRNPRAIETVLEQSSTIEPAPLDATTLERHQAAAARWLLECI